MCSELIFTFVCEQIYGYIPFNLKGNGNMFFGVYNGRERVYTEKLKFFSQIKRCMTTLTTYFLCFTSNRHTGWVQNKTKKIGTEIIWQKTQQFSNYTKIIDFQNIIDRSFRRNLNQWAQRAYSTWGEMSDGVWSPYRP